MNSTITQFTVQNLFSWFSIFFCSPQSIALYSALFCCTQTSSLLCILLVGLIFQQLPFILVCFILSSLFFSNKLFWKILESFSFLPLTAPSCYTYKTFWINALKGNAHLREWTFENFQKRHIRSFSRVRSVDLDCPLSNIIPKKKETKYQLRNKSAHRLEIKTDRFKNVFVNRLILR